MPGPAPLPGPPPAPDPAPDPAPVPSAPSPHEPAPPPALPRIPHRGFGSALALGAGAIGLSIVASAARSMSGQLLPVGVLPATLRWIELVARAGIVLVGIGAVLALVPEALEPLVPWIGVALALAVGWSARDALPDLVAWAFLSAEGRLRPGTWVRGRTFEGVVQAIRPRILLIVDRRGQLTGIPNRVVGAEPLQTDPSGHPEVTVDLALPHLSPETARAALREAALLSPWIAPRSEPEVESDPARPGNWTVRMRVVDLRYADRFVGTFPERVTEVLGPTE